MWQGIGIVCEVLVAYWVLAYLLGKADPNHELRKALHQLVLSLLKRWTKQDGQVSGQ